MDIQNSAKRLKNILKYLIALLVVAFISTLFPNTVRFKYSFEKGRTWNYDDLVAPFDFAVKKNDLEAQNDLAKQEASFSPYYLLNFEIEKQRKALFQEAFQKRYEAAKSNVQYTDVIEFPSRYQTYGEQFLTRIYQQGVIQLTSQHEEKPTNFVIHVIKGNTTEQHVLGDFLTLKDARALLVDSLPYSNLKEAEFLYPILEQQIVSNIFYSPERTAQFKEDYLTTISTTKDIVKKGQMIVAKGTTITDEIYDELASFKAAYEEEISKDRSKIGIFLGYFLMTSIIISVFLLYIYRYSRNHFDQFGKFIFLLSWFVIYSYLVYLIDGITVLSVYMIPFCIIPMVIKHFFDSRLALFTHLIVILIASFLTSIGYEFTFIQIIAGIVAVIGNIDSRDLSQFFYSILFIFLAYLLTFLGLSLIQEGKITISSGQVISALFINVFLILLAYPIIPLLERLFGFTSTSLLLELSSTNRPLIKKLIVEAPGTWQHSLQVANIAEAAATAIGADALLVKVGALYHDIGKTVTPEYFIENQKGYNAHQTLSALQSAEKIIAHVHEGVKLAKKYRLPQVITDFIETHHGTTKVEFFYRKYKEEHPEELVDEQQFRYLGIKPFTKEQTILMVADSLEAASKTLKEPTMEDINQLIDRIIHGKITGGQFAQAEFTFQELEICRKVFQESLYSIHHARVEYPKEIELKQEPTESE